ncbi:hypothetical protein CHS0354_020440 [Potamilus streckersoni]|uniref:Uncharacterized protein n=1 Tax=Potamilus streckersoni TaxID=2493646 RepID=A0AAE0SM65_9BIVA|nr:hypothetical protein CHS0354_020440 [Potamilus streckersoni]
MSGNCNRKDTSCKQKRIDTEDYCAEELDHVIYKHTYNREVKFADIQSVEMTEEKSKWCWPKFVIRMDCHD